MFFANGADCYRDRNSPTESAVGCNRSPAIPRATIGGRGAIAREQPEDHGTSSARTLGTDNKGSLPLNRNLVQHHLPSRRSRRAARAGARPLPLHLMASVASMARQLPSSAANSGRQKGRAARALHRHKDCLARARCFRSALGTPFEVSLVARLENWSQLAHRD